ncbi:MAG: transposase [Planctomycetota bacterium]
MGETKKSGGNIRRTYKDQHRFEHWYRDNQVYFITVRTRLGYPAFADEDAKHIFWNRFNHYTKQYGFTPFVTSLLDNHYHTLGYLKHGNQLPRMMQGIQGSTAKLVNDTLPQRHVPFWHENKNKSYFDGCIRDEKQCRLSYRYVCIQSERHGVCDDWAGYAHTRINVELECAVERALERNAFLTGVPYKRYQQRNPKGT